MLIWCWTEITNFLQIILKRQLRGFPRSCLITWFVIRETRPVPLMEQELPTLPEHLRPPPGFIGVLVSRSLVLCFVYRCLSFVLFLLAIVLYSLCLSIYIWILIALLVSSNSSFICRDSHMQSNSLTTFVCISDSRQWWFFCEYFSVELLNAIYNNSVLSRVSTYNQ